MLHFTNSFSLVLDKLWVRKCRCEKRIGSMTKRSVKSISVVRSSSKNSVNNIPIQSLMSRDEGDFWGKRNLLHDPYSLPDCRTKKELLQCHPVVGGNSPIAVGWRC